MVGSGSTLISYLTFLFGLRFFKLHYLIANILGFACSIIFSYNCNRRWTFNADASKNFIRYFCFYLLSLILSSILLKIIVEFFDVIPEIANIITIAVSTCINFLGIKFLVFKK
jgi:putative flippase GtrA